MTTIDEAIAIGRRLRVGTLSTEAAMKTAGLDPSSLETAALAKLETVNGVDAESIAARDDVESLIVVLGIVGEDARVVKRAAEVDERIMARRDEFGGETLTPSDPWLGSIAWLGTSLWWLDPIALAPLREAVRAFDPARVFRDVRRVPMKLRARQAPARLHAEVVGMDDDPARVALDKGAIVARLFDGEVEVHAVGLRVDQEDVAPGFCIIRKGGGTSGISAVTLGGEPAGQGQSGWWAPLPSGQAGALALVVHLGEVEDSLDLEVIL